MVVFRGCYKICDITTQVIGSDIWYNLHWDYFAVVQGVVFFYEVCNVWSIGVCDIWGLMYGVCDKCMEFVSYTCTKFVRHGSGMYSVCDKCMEFVSYTCTKFVRHGSGMYGVCDKCMEFVSYVCESGARWLQPRPAAPTT